MGGIARTQLPVKEAALLCYWYRGFSRGGWEHLYVFLCKTEEYPEHIQEHSKNCFLCHMHNFVRLWNQRTRRWLFFLIGCFKHKASSRERLCFSPPREVSVGETNQLTKHQCLLQPLSVLLQGSPGCVSRARDPAVISKVGSQGRAVWPREILPREILQMMYVLHCTQSYCQQAARGFVLFCFSCGYIWRPVCYNIDSLWEIIRHRKNPREARGR